MSRIDHYGEAKRLLDVYQGKSLEAVTVAQVHATLAQAEQLRIANVIALASLADDRWGVFAGEAGSMGSLFDNPETELGNLRVKPEIREVLGL